MAGAGGDDELVVFAQHDQHAAGVNERTTTLDDQLEHSLEVGFAADRVGDVARRAQRLNGPLGLVAAPLARLVQASVLDRGRRPLGQHHGRVLVLRGELAAALLLGQVQVAPRLAADHDRDAQERRHRRVPGRKPVALRMIAHVGQAQRARILDQHAEHTPSTRQLADRAQGRLAVETGGHEALELCPPLVEHPERGVLSAGDRARLLQDALEHRLGVELGHERPADIQQTADPIVILRLVHQTPR